MFFLQTIHFTCAHYCIWLIILKFFLLYFFYRKERRVGVTDLRLKLQKKSAKKTNQSGNGSLSGGIRDLREKLSGTMTSQSAEAARPKPRAVPEASKPARKVAVEAPVPETKSVSTTVSKKKPQQKVCPNYLRSTPFL